MNVMENLMFQQMQQMAAAMTNTLPQTGSAGKDRSFQDMMAQAGKDNHSSEAPVKEETTQERPADSSAAEGKPAVQKPAKDAAKSQELNGDPNAMQNAVDLFRPEILDVSQNEVSAEVFGEVEAAADAPTGPVPVHFVKVPNSGHPSWISEDRKADPQIGAVLPPRGRAELPIVRPIMLPQGVVQEPVQEPVQVETLVQTVQQMPEGQEAVPGQEAGTIAAEIADIPETVGEEPEKNAGENHGQEMAGLNQQPLFRDLEATPVKVAEHYESVDTQAPDMDEKLADTIRQAADDGAQRIQLTLNPANLGRVTVEMTRDASGTLQVALHVVSGKAEQLLGQHLDGLHAALQAYGQEVKVEVQRSQEAPQQQDQHQANPDGHNQNQQQRHQERRREQHTGDFLQKMRLGLFETESL